MSDGPSDFDAWNPGLNSDIPSDLLPLVTLYNPENSETTYRDAQEAARFCGLKPQELVAFKVTRLAMHAVLIRVTADLFVPDGPRYEELGLNLRSMANRLLTHHVLPKMQMLEQEFAQIRDRAIARLNTRLMADVYARGAGEAQNTRPSLWRRLFGQDDQVQGEKQLPEILALGQWHDELATTDSALERACLTALHTIVGGIVGQRGRLMADKALVIRLATILVCNSYGSAQIGALIGPIIHGAADGEGYRLLPYQAEPFVMNVKGASAAGKSTIRPLQRELATRLGVPWEDFALVSPDYWRKFLLDYDSLGDDYKYAAMLTGQELEIVDKKLDEYMAEKAIRQEMPHLLIDRFRFDSFDAPHNGAAGGRLLSRFGHTVFMFFIITPPVETVERAWKRGQKTGRYKAVDDLLFHNIEAYTGMPQLFLNWVNKKKQRVHFEFLDNDVPFGARPKTVAFGWNGEITILDLQYMRRLNSYRRINVEATRPQDVYLAATGSESDLLETFVEKIPTIRFVDPQSLELRAQIKDRDCVFQADDFFKKNGLEMLCHSGSISAGENSGQTNWPKIMKMDIATEKKFTIGMWGTAAL
jgi:hypothetical protein